MADLDNKDIFDAQKSSSSSSEDDSQIYDVERIVGERRIGNRREFLIKWLGYGEELNNWEPAENLNCPKKIEEWEAEKRRRSTATSIDDFIVRDQSDDGSGPSESPGMRARRGRNLILVKRESPRSSQNIRSTRQKGAASSSRARMRRKRISTAGQKPHITMDTDEKESEFEESDEAEEYFVKREEESVSPNDFGFQIDMDQLMANDGSESEMIPPIDADDREEEEEKDARDPEQEESAMQREEATSNEEEELMEEREEEWSRNEGEVALDIEEEKEQLSREDDEELNRKDGGAPNEEGQFDKEEEEGQEVEVDDFEKYLIAAGFSLQEKHSALDEIAQSAAQSQWGLDRQGDERGEEATTSNGRCSGIAIVRAQREVKKEEIGPSQHQQKMNSKRRWISSSDEDELDLRLPTSGGESSIENDVDCIYRELVRSRSTSEEKAVESAAPPPTTTTAKRGRPRKVVAHIQPSKVRPVTMTKPNKQPQQKKQQPICKPKLLSDELRDLPLEVWAACGFPNGPPSEERLARTEERDLPNYEPMKPIDPDDESASNDDVVAKVLEDGAEDGFDRGWEVESVLGLNAVEVESSAEEHCFVKFVGFKCPQMLPVKRVKQHALMAWLHFCDWEGARQRKALSGAYWTQKLEEPPQWMCARSLRAFAEWKKAQRQQDGNSTESAEWKWANGGEQQHYILDNGQPSPEDGTEEDEVRAFAEAMKQF